MATLNSAAAAGLPASPRQRWRWLGGTRGVDVIAWLVTMIAALCALVLTVWLVVELWRSSSLPRHQFGFKFLLDRTWDPVFGHFGALPFVYGTLVTAAVAMTISIPLGVGAAIFLAELAPRALSDTLTFMVELLAAVPSVVF